MCVDYDSMYFYTVGYAATYYLPESAAQMMSTMLLLWGKNDDGAYLI